MSANHFSEVTSFFQKILQLYTSHEHLDLLLEAKEVYFSQTGKVDEEDEDFESRMVDFNEWYILQFVPSSGTRTLIREYLKKNKVDDEIFKAFTQFRHSVFEYVGKSFSKQDKLLDFLLDKNIKLSKEPPISTIVKGDLFAARVVNYKDENYILGAMSVIPKEVRRTLKKEARRVRKIGSPAEVENFLLKIESLKSKWKHYGHVDITKIFNFS